MFSPYFYVFTHSQFHFHIPFLLHLLSIQLFLYFLQNKHFNVF